jgi:cation diffusion facilitator family transporter
VHVIGDMIQSIGVIIAAALIYVWPEYKIADPICTYLFSILVIITTIPVFKDCVRILMESVPKGIEPEKLRKSILSVQGVTQVTDIHVWALGGNKNVLTAHITVA